MKNTSNTDFVCPKFLSRRIDEVLSLRGRSEEEKRIRRRQFCFEAISERIARYAPSEIRNSTEIATKDAPEEKNNHKSPSDSAMKARSHVIKEDMAEKDLTDISVWDTDEAERIIEAQKKKEAKKMKDVEAFL